MEAVEALLEESVEQLVADLAPDTVLALLDYAVRLLRAPAESVALVEPDAEEDSEVVWLLPVESAGAHLYPDVGGQMVNAVAARRRGRPHGSDGAAVRRRGRAGRGPVVPVCGHGHPVRCGARCCHCLFCGLPRQGKISVGERGGLRGGGPAAGGRRPGL
ncbi:hypothetical protein [Kitasatospora cineracea]|uniref:hypothetical protein n=1 Tax=Kitasatospora cineracea TaxID=88074 RepID=UPI000F4F3D27|nr:hypothetical protein [Kitasatospora cineracea]